MDLAKRGGWALMIRVGMVERPLDLKLGGPSLFRSLDTLSDTLIELVLVEFQVHSSGTNVVCAPFRLRHDSGRP